MDPPDIPGFYYDRERKKYFKIQPSHLLVPAASKYSHDAVNREKAIGNKRKREETDRALREEQTIKRSSILLHPGAWGLKREVGGLKTDPSAHAKALASGFESGTFLTPRLHWSEVGRDSIVRCFDYDAETRTLIGGVEGSTHLLISTFVEPNISRLAAPTWYRRDIQRESSTISSIHITPHRRVIVTTRGSASPPEIQISSLRPQDSTNDRVYMDSTVCLRPYSHTTVFSSAPNPFVGGAEVMAVGTLGSVLRIDDSPTSWTGEVAFNKRNGKGRPDAALSLEWLCPHTFAAGFRSGDIVLYDTRSEGYKNRMRHRSSAIAIRRADHESRFVVAGLESTMNMYDLRMAKHQTAGSSRSVFRFDGYENAYTEASGVDVHRLSGLVAAAQENGRVQLYSVKDGSKVRELQVPDQYPSGYDPSSRSRVSCLRFVEEVVGPDRGRTKLLGSISSRVVQFA